MSLQVVWMPEAEKTFNDQIDYLASIWSTKVLHSFIDRVFEVIERVSEQPEVFPVFRKEQNIHRCVVHRNLSMYYRIGDDKIQILIFWPNKRNPDDLPI